MAQNNQPYSEFGYYLHLAVALIDKSGEALFQRELGISLRQFMLLRLFETTGTLPSQQVLVARLGIAKSAVSRHIDIARRNGWIDVQTAAVAEDFVPEDAGVVVRRRLGL
jgi:DNA-binding MarR family transcriptional regulator